MLSQSTNKKIANLFKAIAHGEAQVEILRQVLSEKSYFDTTLAFKKLSQGYPSVTSQRILSFLGENGIRISKSDAFYLVRLLDTNKDGRLNYTEFLDAVLPKTDLELRRQVVARNAQSAEEDNLPHQIEHAIAKIFEEELITNKECEAIRQELASSEDFSLMAAFRELDENDKGFVDIHDIAIFMDKINIPLADAELEHFMLKADSTGDGAIRYSQFLELLSAEEPTPVNFSEDQKLDRSEQHIDRLRQSFGSPSKKKNTSSPTKSAQPIFGSPIKIQNQGQNLIESIYSPNNSTKASIPNTSSQPNSAYRTPTKLNASKVLHEELERTTASKSSHSPMKSPYQVNMGPIRPSPMKPKEEAQLVKALTEVLENIHNLEKAKNEIALKDDFNLYNAFAVFDLEKKGYVNVKQLEKGFERLNIRTSSGEVALLIKRLDTDLDGLIKFGDLAHVLTPRTGEFAKVLNSRDPHYFGESENALQAFNEETMLLYRNLLKSLIEEESLFESVRQRLVKRKTFNLHDAYNCLDRYDNGFITTEQFRDLLEQNGVFYSQKDVNVFVERFAKSSRGRISYYEWVQEMTPKSVEKF